MPNVFTYGTLRPTLYPGVVDRFRLIPKGHATLRGPFKLLNLGAFPGLIKDYGFPIATITGEVVETEDLRQCDAYEGYNPNGRGLYDRQEVGVKLYNGITVECWVYLFNVDREWHDPRVCPIPSGDWSKR